MTEPPNRTSTLDTSAIPGALTPIYQTTRPNEPIRLYEGPFSAIDNAARSITMTGTLDWSWQPHARTYFTGACHGDPVQLLATNRFQLTLDAEGVTVPAIVAHLDLSGNIRAALSKTVEIEPALPINGLMFHVPNYHALHGLPVTYHEKDIAYCRLELDAENWHITLDATEAWKVGDPSTLLHTTGAQSGNAISHVGLLTKTTGNLFTLNDAREILECLGLFLSFTLGRWTTPILLVGLDTSGAHVSWDWSARRVDPYVVNRSWPALYPPPQQSLPQAWQGFVNLRREWGPALGVCLEWYLQANSTSVSATGVILSQTALELLFWQIIGEPVLLGEVDQKLRFSDTLRLLLNVCSIPSAIPPTLPNLVAEAQKKNNGWVDGPHALTVVRNTFVHASKLSKALDANFWAVEEVRQLALWYIELVLLRKMAYTGSVSSRIDGDQITPMP